MSTFLELCQELRSDAGLSGSGPASTLNQTGILVRCVRAVRDAYTNIQDSGKLWKWMYKTDGEEESIINTRELVPQTGFERVHKNTFKIYEKAKGASDITRMTYMEWGKFDRKYGALQSETAGRPRIITETPQGNFQVYPKSDKVFTITFHYQEPAQLLVQPDDIPDMPVEFHPLIKYDAMILFGGTEDAPEVVQTGTAMRGALWNSLVWKQELRTEGPMIVRPV